MTAEFTALEQSLEQVLEYMLSKDMVKLSRVVDPPVSLGKWKDKFCKFHRAVGHDTEHCFVLKNIIQDCIDKNLLIEDEDEEQPAVLTKPFPEPLQELMMPKFLCFSPFLLPVIL